MHFREGVWEGVAAVACECPGLNLLVGKLMGAGTVCRDRGTYQVRRETEARMLNCEQPMTK